MILLAMALIPAIVLIIFIYKQDKVESEPKRLIFKTFMFGVLSIIPAVIIEVILGNIIGRLFYVGSLMYVIVDNVIGVALVEEFVKMKAAKIAVWKRPEFNFRFDAIVYCVASALGFAALENILYVFENGIAVAITRAILSVPSHAIDGVAMGYFFGLAKVAELDGDKRRKRKNMILSIVVPVVLHGFYDAALSMQNALMVIAFLAFVVIMDIWAIIFIREQAKKDRPL